MTPVRLEPEARQDILDAWQWCEQRRPGLGGEFVDAVDDALELISAQPLSFSVVHYGVRQALVRRFPYSICYVVDGPAVYVIAVLHASRGEDPWGRWAR